ncbi:hypothetical protein NH286_00250 [Anaerococcus sp. NML200574]|uniref:hypothetical protein n=1 Tax=Anaerococcus sp. NML200574 TaxID=2954486 RepID=UPI002238AA76|nr:hypothetical protein [Anaerococcus sp. NML200574]MCW6677582.1 hypothetical protein [Anaerococcus sp. NML200574]
MDDLLLIKKINPNTDTDTIYPYSFQLDELFTRKDAMDILSALKNKGILPSDEFMVKDKTFTVEIYSKDTTKVIKEILDKDFKIYGVYIPYEDYLEKGRINE